MSLLPTNNLKIGLFPDQKGTKEDKNATKKEKKALVHAFAHRKLYASGELDTRLSLFCKTALENRAFFQKNKNIQQFKGLCEGCQADSTENATTPTSAKSKTSYSSSRFQIKLISRFEFVPRDTEKSEFLLSFSV